MINKPLLRHLPAALDGLLVVVSLLPVVTMLAAGSAETGDGFINFIFGIGGLFYFLASASAMVQRFFPEKLSKLHCYRLRRIVLFVSGYSALLVLLINLQEFSGFRPPELQPPPGGAGSGSVLALAAAAAGLIVSYRYYGFLGRKRDEGKGARKDG